MPSKPWPASRSLSSRTFASATSLTAASRRDGMNAAMPPIACAPRRWHVLHEQLGVRAHERHRHRHVAAVGQHELLAVAELLDDAEDVVPAAGVQPGGVLAQLVEDLVHLERGEDRLDQDGRADRAAPEAELVLGDVERVVPQARLEVRLELREIEVRPAAGVEQRAAVVEDVEAEVEEARADAARRRASRASRRGASRAGARRASRPRRSARSACLAGVQGDRPPHGIAQVDLALDARSPTSASSRPRSRP